MGSRGPAPKRDAQRAGHRSKSERADKVVVTQGGKVTAPAPDPEWCDRAREMYAALTESGQARYFEPSDWALAQVLCDMLSEFYKPGIRRSAELFKHVMQGFQLLGVTEVDRRRARIEVDRKGGEDNSSDASDETKDALAARLAKLASNG